MRDQLKRKLARRQRLAQWQEVKNIPEMVEKSDIADAVDYAFSDAQNMMKTLQEAQSEIAQNGMPHPDTVANLKGMMDDFYALLEKMEKASGGEYEQPIIPAPIASLKDFVRFSKQAHDLLKLLCIGEQDPMYSLVSRTHDCRKVRAAKEELNAVTEALTDLLEGQYGEVTEVEVNAVEDILSSI